ncbi:MAG TPA: GNAT family N-acetyltransferase [Acidimicrobiia bacterium]|nr:GNAT family N-acetyltransferase [Acidimicrobiia bacterium]
MEIREPVAEDALELGRIHVRAWQEGYKDGLMPQTYLDGLDPEERAGMWAEALSRPPRPRTTRLVSVDESGRPCGFILTGPAEVDPTIGEVYALNVDPDVWGRGHGGALLARGVASLREAGFADAVLWVHRDNVRARRFYERHSWDPTGEEQQAEVLGIEVPEVRYRRSLVAAS